MSYQEMIDELLACRSVNDLIDVLLACATDIYETGYAAGRGDYAQA